MIRILHSADWHLGHSFHGYDRDYEHSLFLEWMVRTLVTRRIDVLLIAGDIFDSVNPSAAAQRQFFDFLARAHAALPGLQIVLTAGNHDAGARLEAPAGLLESLNITIVGTVPRNPLGEIEYHRFLVPLKDPNGNVEAVAIAVPFLRPADVPNIPESSDFYLDGIRELYRRAIEEAVKLRDRVYPKAALVALGHCHMQDAIESRDSERRIVIGGAEALGVDTFPTSLAYVALGHLHKPQELDHGRIRYCGSPIPMSFSEKDYEHRVVEIILDGENGTAIETLPIPKSVVLRRLPADKAVPIAEVLQLLADTIFNPEVAPEAHPFLEIRVLDDGPDPTRRRRIEEALDGKCVRLASIKLESLMPDEASELITPGVELTLTDLSALDPVEIMLAAHRERYAAEADGALLAALREILAAEPHVATEAAE